MPTEILPTDEDARWLAAVAELQAQWPELVDQMARDWERLTAELDREAPGSRRDFRNLRAE